MSTKCKVKASKVRVGDLVTLEALLVTYVGNDYINFNDARGFACHFHEDWLAGHHPAPGNLAIGDRVHIAGHLGRVGVIRGIDGDEAWVKWPGWSTMNPIQPVSILEITERFDGE
jgi:hypothetical protein